MTFFVWKQCGKISTIFACWVVLNKHSRLKISDDLKSKHPEISSIDRFLLGYSLVAWRIVLHWDSGVTGNCNFFQFRREARTPFPIRQLINSTSEIRSRYRCVHPFGTRSTISCTIDHTRSADSYLCYLYEIKSYEKNKHPPSRGKEMKGGLFNYRRVYHIIHRCSINS